ncbi:flavocytochrome c [Sutterella sp.]|uniref:FAD-dependent oxidoreductase n=1 Tax=Sutterella sp. TaxID=1981025 RepID=UPI0026DF34E6|nr:flavocytochrome c [Sutterella sp.]MDO5532380.1 flavocytochrome c [Sutterella sp.]
MTDLNRRQFLNTAAIGAAAAAAGGLAHAAPAPASICALPAKWEETYELVVVGSGGAGLATAVMAAQKGVKKILVLEKMGYIGGNTAISGGGFNSYDPPRQKAQNIQDSPENHAKNTMQGGDNRANPELVRTMTENSYAAVQWLESMGMKFKPDVYQIYGGLFPRCHAPFGSLGSDYIKVLKAQCDQLGIEIRRNSRVTRVIRETPLTGDVLGVEYEDAKKVKHAIRATKSTVIAAGGFGANAKMRALYDPRMLNLTTTNHTGATGDLIPLLQDIGAATTGMDFIQCNPGCPPGRKHRVIMHLIVKNFIMVDMQGKRFVAEDERRDVIRDAILSLPKQTAFSLIDQNGFDETNPGHQKGIEKGFETGDAWKADTIEELAKKINVEPAVLRKTIDDFNAGVDAQKDALGKAPGQLRKIERAPFYAAYAGMSVHHTMGGIVINTKTQVIDRRGEIIPKLHAVGEITGGIHGTNRLGGNAICDIFTFGRLTGMYVAEGI